MFTFPLSFYAAFADLPAIVSLAGLILGSTYDLLYDTGNPNTSTGLVLSADYTVTHDSDLYQDGATGVLVGATYAIVYDIQPTTTTTGIILGTTYA